MTGIDLDCCLTFSDGFLGFTIEKMKGCPDCISMRVLLVQLDSLFDRCKSKLKRALAILGQAKKHLVTMTPCDAGIGECKSRIERRTLIKIRGCPR